MNLSSLDVLVLAVYLGAMVALGLWFGRGATTVAEFMVAGRNPPWWLILASIVATETSTVTFLSIPGFAYGRDLTWLQLPMGFVLGRLAVSALLLPLYFRGTLFTAYELLEGRFGVASRRLTSVMFLASRTAADGLRLFLTALVVQEMAGFSLAWAVALLGLTTILYCALGGMRAVLWTDFVQLALYVGGAVVALGVLLGRLPDGWSGLLSSAEAAGKLRIFDLSLNPSEPFTLWAGLLGGAVLALGSHGVDQMMVQRYLSAGALPAARRALVASGFVVLAQFALFLIIGIGLWRFYELFPPALAFERPDRVFARFILEELPSGVVGLLLGAVFAAAMSTLSSSLNSSATAAAHDLIFPTWGHRLSEAKKLRLTQGLTVAFGLGQIGVGLIGPWLASSVVNAVLGVTGFTTGIVLGIFLLGLFVPRAGERAAFAALLGGLAGMSWVYFATPLAWPWYALAGSLLTLGCGLAASLAWPRSQS